MTLTLQIENFHVLDDGGPVSILVPERGIQVGRRSGMDWVLLVATQQLRNAFERLHLPMLDLAEARDGGEGLRREWVAQKIYKLINDHLAAGRAETVQEIRDLSIRHNVPLPYGADFPL